MFSELNLAFEAPLFVGSSREGIDRTYDGIQSGIGRHNGDNSSEVKIFPLLWYGVSWILVTLKVRRIRLETTAFSRAHNLLRL